MMGELSRNWWMPVLRGVLAIVFGLLCFFAPGISLSALVVVFAVYAFMDGLFEIAAAMAGQGDRPWWALVLRGIAGIVAGGIALFWPGITALALLFVIAAWAIVSGAFEITTAIRLRRQVEGEWRLALAGVVSLLFGFFLIMAPGRGALAVLWLIGGYAIVMGALLIGLGFRLRTHAHRVEPDAIGRAA
jgi:uncharacterized membrane protein HdeD (DUF308 family)